MKVELISYTPDALETLIFTKNTRLTMTGTGIQDVKDWPMEKKLAELAYMKGTIQSSWEFVDYMFVIREVTRAFTHQLVRHRAGTAFAQQSQRSVDVSGFTFEVGDSINADEELTGIYNFIMGDINLGYQALLRGGAKVGDARGVLPTNIHTNIVFKANLRTLHDMALKRLCVKAQGEFQNVFREIVARVSEVHPWANQFMRVECAWTGTCLFPNLPLAECPVKPRVYNQFTGFAYDGNMPATTEEIYQLHRERRGEVQPVIPAP
jgi:flavin-dependent thymidylate synthase